MNDTLIDFAAADRYEAKDRGVVFTGPSPVRMRRENCEIKGRTVRIEGCPYRVIGVERFLSGAPYIEVGEPIGLMVEPL